MIGLFFLLKFHFFVAMFFRVCYNISVKEPVFSMFTYYLKGDLQNENTL